MNHTEAMKHAVSSVESPFTITILGASGDLTNDHPISFTYDGALVSADGGLNDPTTQASGLPGGGTVQDDLLFSDSLECGSCHDVHDDSNGNFLIKSNANSALCTTCHNK